MRKYVMLIILVSYKLYFSVYREPIDMNIPQTHEDGDEKPAIMKVFVLFYFFNHDNTSVCWCDDKISCIFNIEKSRRTPVEIEYDSIANTKYGKETPERNFRLKAIPKEDGNCYKSNPAVKELIGTFSVYSDFSKFP